MFGAPKTVIGLDVGSYSVKAVALQPNRDRLTLAGCAQARIGTSEPAEVIRKVIEQLGVKPRRVVTSVSGRSVIVRQVETPRMPPQELKAHIAYEADKYIPFGSEEVIIDCQPLPEVGDAKSASMQVLLVAVRRGFVEDHVSQLRAAGISPEIIDVDVFALSNAYELLGPGAKPDADKKDATALIDIGASKSNIAIVQGTRLLFTREIYQAGNEITDAIVRTFNESAEDIERIKANPGETIEALIDAAMPAFEDLANEIRLSFDYVEGQFEAQVGTVVLSGGSSQLAGIAGILGNILGRPVHVFDPLAGLDLVPSRYDIHTLDATSPSLAVALGLASHLTAVPVIGLGGANSHGWQPRHARIESVKSALMQQPPIPEEVPEEAPQDVAADMAPPLPFNDQQDAPPLPPPAPMPEGLVMTTPPPMVPPPMINVAASPLPAPSPNEISPDMDAAPGSTTEELLVDPRQSNLLVVLDEDQEMPPTGHFDKSGTGSFGGEGQPGSGSITRALEGGPLGVRSRTPSQVLKIDGFADDEEDKAKEPSLPDLPKI